jgi:phosphatidate cytidylyltransferase
MRSLSLVTEAAALEALMRKIVSRLLIFFIGVPLMAAVILIFPKNHHLFLNILVTIFSGLGALELRGLLKRPDYILPKIESCLLGIFFPIGSLLFISCGVSIVSAFFFPMLGILWIFISRTLNRKDDFSHEIDRIVISLAVLAYPGLLLTTIMYMALFPHAELVILVFFLTVFANDSFAWLFGILLGKNNRGLFPVSPNKSVAGFIGGFLASAAVGACAPVIWPEAFFSTLMPSIPAGIILGLVSALAGTLGDLSESAIKRCAGVKDSGVIIPGRGGALDSIDSIAIASPVYFFLFYFLFGVGGIL